MKKLLLALALMAPIVVLGAGRISVPASSSGGFTDGSDLSADDITAKTITSTGTSPSLTATGGVFTSSVSVLNDSPNLFGRRHGLTAAPAALLTLNKTSASTDFSTASAHLQVGADDFTAGRWNIIGFGFIDGDSQLPCAVAEQTMNAGTGGGDIVVLCRTHAANGSTAPSEVARFSATNGVMLGLGATVSTFTSSGKLVLGDNINTTGKYLIGDNSAASGSVPYFRVTTAIVEANAGGGQSINFYDSGTNAMVLTPGTGWAVYGSTLTMNRSGNIGIGTSAPASKLHVSGGSVLASTGALVVEGSVARPLELGARTSDGTFSTFTVTSNGVMFLNVLNSASALPTIPGLWVRDLNGVATPVIGFHQADNYRRGVRNPGGNRDLDIFTQNDDADGNVNIYTGNNTLTASFRDTGGFRLYSRTIAQLLAITPDAVGEQFFCNNCSPAKIVISTGTSAGNFADAIGGAFQ